MRKIAISELNTLFSKINENAALYIPATDNAGGAVYTKYEDGVEYLDILNTVRSPKDFFFPQTENLMEFKVKGKNIELFDIREEAEDFVIFGVRACDVKSFDILDRVFLSEPVDSYYQNRRAHGIIISLACTRPSETCFCTAFGIDTTAPAGDISAWKCDDTLYLEANTDKGAKLLNTLSDITEECGNEAVKAQQESVREIMKKLPLASLTTDKFGGNKTKEYFDSPLWAELSEACLGCGTCTFVCPTCQCYDIKDFDTGNGVIR
ncbi:MAG: 4Fe-4S ferredoxin, partial [Ruminococcus sp.]|nr:4Fe-4S ferredoxin [Ruminococcus sp.]